MYIVRNEVLGTCLYSLGLKFLEYAMSDLRFFILSSQDYSFSACLWSMLRIYFGWGKNILYCIDMAIYFLKVDWLIDQGMTSNPIIL